MEVTKKKFSAEGFSHFIEHISKTSPDMAKTDWRDLVRSHFDLDKEQEHSLTSVSRLASEEVHSSFVKIAEYARSGRTVKGQIVETGKGTHEALAIINTGGDGLGFIIHFKIACCDANCRHWHWGWHCH